MPEDFESISYAIRNSNQFRSFKMSIEKSQLQNHIHVIGRFEEFEPTNKYFFEAEARSYGPRGNSSQRNTYMLQASAEFKKRGPANAPSSALTIFAEDSKAESSLSESDISLNNKVTLSENDRSVMNHKSWSSLAINYRYYIGEQEWDRLYADIGLVGHSISAEDEWVNYFRVRVGYKLDFRESDLFVEASKSHWELSALYARYGVTVVEPSGDIDERSQGLLFLGLSYDYRGSRSSLQANVLRAATDKLHNILNASYRWSFLNFGGMDHAVNASSNVIFGAILPEHNHYLSNQTKFDLSYHLLQSLTASPIQHGFDFSLGLSTTIYSSPNDIAETQRDDQNDGILLTNEHIGLDYTWKSEFFDGRIGIQYFSKRVR